MDCMAPSEHIHSWLQREWEFYHLKEQKLLNEKHLRSEAGWTESCGQESLIDSMPHKAVLWP